MIVTFYDNVRDNLGVAFDIETRDLILLLAEQSVETASPDDKLKTRTLSTARYPEGATRSKANAIDASAIALDVDEGWTLDAAEDAVEDLMTPYVIYTTTKHDPAHHRFRIVLFLNRPVNAVEYEALWLGLAKRFGVEMDAKTRDISRLSIVPRAWEGRANEFRWDSRGILLDVDAILKHYPADPNPEPLRVETGRVFDALREHRLKLRQMLNADVDPATLTDLDTSPIIPAKALSDAMSSERSSGRTFKLLCSVAASAIRQGYIVGVDELATISREFTRRVNRGRITDFEHRNDSRNALKWAERNVRDAI